MPTINQNYRKRNISERIQASAPDKHFAEAPSSDTAKPADILLLHTGSIYIGL
jgi:hypothetical protein